jgi:hypothetical protein
VEYFLPLSLFNVLFAQKRTLLHLLLLSLVLLDVVLLLDV